MNREMLSKLENELRLLLRDFIMRGPFTSYRRLLSQKRGQKVTILKSMFCSFLKTAATYHNHFALFNVLP
jgi:hypothetical protein